MPPLAVQSRLERRFDTLVATRRGPAVLDAGGTIDFEVLGALAAEWGAVLERAGVAGQRVGLLIRPSRSWVVAFWALQRLGCCVVPLSPLYPATELAQLAQRAGAVQVVCTAEFEGVLSSQDLTPLVVPDSLSATFRTTPHRGHSAERDPRVTQQLSPRSAAGASREESWFSEAPGVSEAESRTALLLFTSGTTGEPKKVPLTCAQVFATVACLSESWGMSTDDTLLHTLPLHHLHGICVALLSTLLSGGATQFLPFSPESVLQHCEQASVLMGVPTQHHRLLAYLDSCPEPERERGKRGLAGLRLITSGSAKLPESLGRRLQAVCGQYPLERYGMTEVGIVLSNPLGAERQPGSCGKPLPGVNAKVMNEQGREVTDGEPGELWIAAPSVFSGYEGNPTATQESFAGAFFKTGDTVARRQDGYFSILGRTSVDIIKSGGEKLSALEIEELLRGHPSVGDVAVVGVPNEEWGEAAIAVVVPAQPNEPEPNEQQSEAALRDWCKQRTANYRVPRRVVFADDLPRNAMGKVNKPQLIEQLRGLRV